MTGVHDIYNNIVFLFNIGEKIELHRRKINDVTGNEVLVPQNKIGCFLNSEKNITLN